MLLCRVLLDGIVVMWCKLDITEHYELFVHA